MILLVCLLPHYMHAAIRLLHGSCTYSVLISHLPVPYIHLRETKQTKGGRKIIQPSLAVVTFLEAHHSASVSYLQDPLIENSSSCSVLPFFHTSQVSIPPPISHLCLPTTTASAPLLFVSNLSQIFLRLPLLSHYITVCLISLASAFTFHRTS